MVDRGQPNARFYRSNIAVVGVTSGETGQVIRFKAEAREKCQGINRDGRTQRGMVCLGSPFFAFHVV